ncbi:helix-turn-helix transcriptional regulator [Paenibacillus antri]|uniref:Helix-turn-helix transcriptional regulator n=1 Tax=Paenibacillus antri TaxID=2582848 RepID=A0A5R9GFH7_9BACL|nr:helix-turn-helix transcriptional regulator [Paenibacillus antri]
MKSHKLCEQIGFSSYPHFCTQFKKITGMTPSEYKQQAKLKSSRSSAGSV